MVLNMGLIAGSLIYIGYVISTHAGELRGSAFSISPANFAGFVLLATASIAISTLYHIKLVSSLQSEPINSFRVGLASAVGQIVRYLPGKVMGLLFQVSYLRGQVSGGTIAIASLVQMLLAYAWAAALAAAILLCSWRGSFWPVSVLFPAAGILWMAQRRGWAQQSLRLLPFTKRFLGDRIEVRPDDTAATVLVTLLIVNWIPFLAGWTVLLSDTHPIGEAMVFAAAYLAASILSTAVIVVPSGIVVREAIFVWIGSRYGLPPSHLLVFSLVARLALTFADLLNAGLFWAAHGWSCRRKAG
ncbi:MAG: hypothetical protein ABIP49_06910 [Lysobacterales bacterium]